MNRHREMIALLSKPLSIRYRLHNDMEMTWKENVEIVLVVRDLRRDVDSILVVS